MPRQADRAGQLARFLAPVVRLRSNGKLYPGRGISTDIVGASIRAYVNALNKIAYEEESV